MLSLLRQGNEVMVLTWSYPPDGWGLVPGRFGANGGNVVKVYCTKYALTRGILEVEGRIVGSSFEEIIPGGSTAHFCPQESFSRRLRRLESAASR